jgi:hypothetical protein
MPTRSAASRSTPAADLHALCPQHASGEAFRGTDRFAPTRRLGADALGIRVIISLVTLPRAVTTSEEAKAIGGIMNIALVAAVFYGVLHDNVTARLCVEYFTVGHPRVIASESPTVLALVWGVLATWWFGTFLGLLLAIAARAGRRAKWGPRDVVKPIGVVLAAIGCASFVGGASATVVHSRTTTPIGSVNSGSARTPSSGSSSTYGHTGPRTWRASCSQSRSAHSSLSADGGRPRASNAEPPEPWSRTWTPPSTRSNATDGLRRSEHDTLRVRRSDRLAWLTCPGHARCGRVSSNGYGRAHRRGRTKGRWSKARTMTRRSLPTPEDRFLLQVNRGVGEATSCGVMPFAQRAEVAPRAQTFARQGNPARAVPFGR